MPGQTDDEQLAGYLDPVVSAGLRDWHNSGRGFPVRTPSARWKPDGGYTAAILVPLIVITPGGERQVLLKVCPPGDSEVRSHDAAWSSGGSFAREHLVPSAYPPWPLEDGRHLTFQEFAGDMHPDCRPLSTFGPNTLAHVAPGLARSLFVDWNEARIRTRAYASVRKALQAEAGQDTGSVLRWTAPISPADTRWIILDEQVMPNPVSLMAGHWPNADRRVDVLVGHTHGDLHLQNILVTMDEDTESLKTFWLIDLATYSADASLTSDPVRLILSVVAQQLGALDDRHHQKLLNAVMKPWEVHSREQPQALVTSVYRTLETAVLQARSGWSGEYRKQYHLSILAQALTFTTFERLGRHRWWFFRLAALAARQFTGEPEKQGSVPHVENPFPSVGGTPSVMEEAVSTEKNGLDVPTSGLIVPDDFFD